ncbi:MAG TPA: hypothetical protein VH590_10025, partial [Ktedonobacterales bacterium]
FPFYPFSLLVVRSRRMNDSLEIGRFLWYISFGYFQLSRQWLCLDRTGQKPGKLIHSGYVVRGLRSAERGSE